MNTDRGAVFTFGICCAGTAAALVHATYDWEPIGAAWTSIDIAVALAFAAGAYRVGRRLIDALERPRK